MEEQEIQVDKDESNYTSFLTPDEKKRLSSYKYCMDFPLSENDLKFMDENGYLVVKNVVEDEICDKLIRQGFNRAKTLFQFDKEDEDTWSAIPFHGIVDIWHAPALYELRQHPNIYSIFSQLLKTNKLCVSIDRISIKVITYYNQKKV
jgi:hypothetical protein